VAATAALVADSTAETAIVAPSTVAFAVEGTWYSTCEGGEGAAGGGGAASGQKSQERHLHLVQWCFAKLSEQKEEHIAVRESPLRRVVQVSPKPMRAVMGTAVRALAVLLLERSGPAVLLLERADPAVLLLERAGPAVLLLERAGPAVLLLELGSAVG
jgi:hypothetical protein